MALYQLVGTIERRNTPQDAASHARGPLATPHEPIASRQPHPDRYENIVEVACRIQVAEQVCESVAMRERNDAGAQTLTHAAHAAQIDRRRHCIG